MPEIFIADEPEPKEDAAYLAEQQAAEMLAVAAWAEWLSTQSETVQALAQEWSTLKPSRFTLSERKDKKGRAVYVCECEHGYHESLQSYEHALFRLVDSHRVREEDKPETRARIQQWGGDYVDPKRALLNAQAIAKQIREENPALSGEERDAMYVAKLDAIEQQAAADAKVVEPTGRVP